jgi:hypothetical protein
MVIGVKEFVGGVNTLVRVTVVLVEVVKLGKSFIREICI